MSDYAPGDLVDVRARDDLPWRPGTVTSADPTCLHVTLDAPLPTADQWSGAARRYGGTLPVSVVTVKCQVEQLVPGQLIQPR